MPIFFLLWCAMCILVMIAGLLQNDEHMAVTFGFIAVGLVSGFVEGVEWNRKRSLKSRITGCKHNWCQTDGGHLERTGSTLTAGAKIGTWKDEKCIKCGKTRKSRDIW